MEFRSEAGIYQYNAHGHRKVKQSAQQRAILQQFREYVEKDNEDLLLYPAKKAIKTGFGLCRDNGNEYNICSNLSIARGRNYTR